MSDVAGAATAPDRLPRDITAPGGYAEEDEVEGCRRGLECTTGPATNHDEH